MPLSAVVMERLEEKHLVQAHALSAAVKWPHRLEDWNFVLKLGHGVAAVAGDDLLGTIIWWPFGEHHATLGMVIVSPVMQGRGLGRRLMSAALEDAGQRTVLLNATAEGLPLYEKLGFRPVGAVRQHQAANAVAAHQPVPAGAYLRPMAQADIDTVIALDEQAAGFRRAEMLMALWQAGQGLVVEDQGAIAAWSFFRRFGRGYVIGPVGAREESAAKALIAAWIAEHGSEFLRVDIPVSTQLSPWLEAQGLPTAGGVVTMARGEAPVPAAGGPRLFALANQALG